MNALLSRCLSFSNSFFHQWPCSCLRDALVSPIAGILFWQWYGPTSTPHGRQGGYFPSFSRLSLSPYGGLFPFDRQVELPACRRHSAILPDVHGPPARTFTAFPTVTGTAVAGDLCPSGTPGGFTIAAILDGHLGPRAAGGGGWLIRGWGNGRSRFAGMPNAGL